MLLREADVEVGRDRMSDVLESGLLTLCGQILLKITTTSQR